MVVKNETIIPIEQQVDSILAEVQKVQEFAAIKNAAIRQAERQEKFDAWKDPEAMAYRKALHEKGALESLWALRAAGECEPATPLPPDSELPKEMRGQQPSTIRAMLRSDPAWAVRIAAHRKATNECQDLKSKMQEKHPELYGIDYTRLRTDLAVKFGDEHKIRDGKTVKIVASSKSPSYDLDKQIEMHDAAEYEQRNFVARVFAGIFRRK